MNKVHRTVWSESRQAYVVAHENAATRGKPSSTPKAVVQAITAALLALGAGQAMAADITVPGTYASPNTQTIILGTGDNLSISAGAVVSDTNHPAVQVSSGTVAGAITNSGTIEAPEAGIAIYGGGVLTNITNTNTGTITASGTGAGIALKTASSITGSISNSGTIDGYRGIQITGNSVIGNDILNSGYIDAARSAIEISISSQVRNIVNSETGTLSGSSIAAISAGGGATIASITNAGTISSGNGIGIDLSNAVITGGITNSGTGSAILGDAAGNRVALNINNTDIGGSIINEGTINGDAGIYLGGTTSIGGAIDNQRLIQGAGTGIAFEGSSTVTGGLTNSGRIIATDNSSSGTAGVYFNGGNVAGIVNSGTIQGQAGIHIENGTVSGNIINSSTGLIRSLGTSSMSAGVILYGSSSVITGSIVNSGTIRGDGIGVWVATSAAINGGITNSGTLSLIEGDDGGIRINDDATVGRILNEGTITSTGGPAIRVEGFSVITNGITNSGLISATGSSAAIYIEDSSVGGIYNLSGGTISGARGIEVYYSSANITNGITNAGLIEGTQSAIIIGASAVVTGNILNQSGGVITSSGSSSSAAAISIKSSAHLAGAIVNHGTISSAVNGIYVSSATIDNGITNSGSGVISAIGAAAGTEIIALNIHNSSVVSGGITNSGQIVATNATAPALSYGIVVRNSTITDGIHNLTGGTISGGGAGLFLQNSGAVQNGITNSGLIQGTDGIGISLSGGAISGGIHNESGGRIVGGNGIAIAASIGDALDSVTNASGGTINGAMYLFSTATDVTNNGLWIVPEDPMSPGTYFGSTITGTFTQGSTGTLRIGAFDTSNYSKISVDGAAVLGGTLDVDVKTGTTLTVGNTLDNVITASGGITGTFASITDNSALFDFTGVYNANDFDLTIAAASGGGGGGLTEQIIVAQGNTPATGAARALDTIFAADPTGPIATLFVPLTTNQQVSDAVSQTLPLLTGGSQVAASAALTGINRVIQARIESNRGLSSGEEFYGDKKFWMKPFGSWADQDDRKGVSGYKAKTGGFALGADATISNATRLGLSFAYAKASTDSNSNVAPNSANVDVFQFVGYGSHALDQDREVNFQVGLGLNKNDGKRRILFAGTTAKADYDSLVATFGAGYGRTYTLSGQTTFTPSIRADYTWIKDKGYTETGAGALNLDVKGRTTDELIVAVDGKLAHEVSKGMTLTANLGLGYDLLNDQASITSAFTGAPTAAFTTKGLDPSPWMVRGGLGIVSNTQSGMEVSARYDVEHRSDFLNQTASVKLRWAF
jgi:autotransporter family porin